MNSWFVPNNAPNSPALRASFPGRGFGGGQIDDVPALAQRVANVLSRLDPDVICIQEGAGEEEVALFLNQFLPIANGRTWSVFGGAGGAQKLIVAARTDRDVTSIAIATDNTEMTTKLDEAYEADTDGDAVLETDTRFARVPLVIDLVAHEQNIRLINCHLKSKFVRNGEDLFNGTQAEKLEFFRAALVNRRRISAEAFRIRTYLDEIFDGSPDRLILLAGDLNDGPGFEFFERRYLTHSVVDLVFGSVLLPEGQLAHPLIHPGQPLPASAFFDDFVEGIQNKPLLLDHIGLSPELSKWLDSARVADAEFDVEVRLGAQQEREKLPSDHRPILAVLTPPT
ncbi:endonuclease exonuclease phosphatase family protein [Leptolyngbya sp. Heron Island J]|nr:endonuclease exonuclease phosphatase family protein [Leptolyngbya sp. Heron Island J]